MTEPRTPDGAPIDPAGASVGVPETTVPTVPPAAAPALDDSPTQAWTSPAEPPAPAPSASAASTDGSGAPPVGAASPYEPAEGLPATRVTPDAAAAPARRGRPGARWILAIVGIVIVAVASFAIVSLVGGRPSASTAMGYMPATTVNYTEIRLDLPGDQRQKLAAFVSAFPGFKDQSAIEPKLDDLFDRLVRAASKDQETWTADIKPWFGGQIGVGVGAPDATGGAGAMSTMSNAVVVVTISDRAKAIDWITKTSAGKTTFRRSTYGGADLFEADGRPYAVAVTDGVLIGGGTVAVKAALDTGGKGTLAATDDIKAAVAAVDQDYVAFSVTRIRADADAILKMISTAQPGVLDKTLIDETALSLIPSWQAQVVRFENDAIVASTVSPPWAIGFDGSNGPSDVLGHVPAKTFLYAEVHDVGPALTAILAKFRALDEAKAAFAQVDQALSLLGGGDSVYGWWGDTGLAVTTLPDGTIGGGLVIHPRDAAVASRFFTTLDGFIALGGSSAGVTSRTEDHNGTKITILDLSAVPGMKNGSLPPGYKPEFAWASNADIAVMGYGSAFVKAVLDAGPGSSLADDARFKALLGRVGAENMGMSFLDVAAIRRLVEPLAQATAPADQWTRYTTDVQPYLAPIDAVIGAVRKDGSVDRGSAAFTVTGP